MSLTLVATPIGNLEDITLRGLNVLKECEIVIGEEPKVTRRFLSALKIEFKETKELYFLNEHSKSEDLEELVDLCKNKNVALMTDCGTPGFCDPGADLVRLCRAENISVQSVPGASSLTVFISLCGLRLDEFYFRGFIPAQKEHRKKALKELKQIHNNIVLMDTPYRMLKLLGEILESFPKKKCVLGVSLTQEKEQILLGTASKILHQIEKLSIEKRSEFMLLLQNIE